jgi:hypothetical protein
MVHIGGVGTRVARRSTRLPLAAAAATLLLATTACTTSPPGSGGGGGEGSGDPPAPPHAVPGEYDGTLASGSTWRAEVPQNWNGVFLLYSHGYLPGFVPGPPAAQVAPDAPTEQALLERGYALAGSSYVSNGWVLETAARDQLDTLDAALEVSEAEPEMVLAYGSSMGGLVTGQIAEVAGDVVDGAMPTCGLMHGGVGLVNYQLDGSHAINQLLDPEHDIELLRYSDYDDAAAAGQAMTAAVDAAQQTPQGRARVALAAALFHMPRQQAGQPTPAAQDWAAIEQAQYQWLKSSLNFFGSGRFDIESQAGGNPSWNVGVDYRRLLLRSADRAVVRALYEEAGLDLWDDLEQLTATADVYADPMALGWLEDTSTVSGDLFMEVLSLHNTSDNLAPVQVETDHHTRIRRMGAVPQHRQVFVDRPGHCAFTPAELVASVQTLERVVAEGRWSNYAEPDVLDASAEDLDLGESNIVDFRPGRFLGKRWRR